MTGEEAPTNVGGQMTYWRDLDASPTHQAQWRWFALSRRLKPLLYLGLTFMASATVGRPNQGRRGVQTRGSD